MKKLKVLHILFITSLFFFLSACSPEQEPQQFVQDHAELFTKEQRTRLSDFQQLLLHEQNVHLLVITLAKPADNLDQKALELFEEQALGSKTNAARGLLLVIDPYRQQARIEVGYDLEGIFPDGFMAGLEYDQMLPFFQQKRIGHGIEALIEFLVNRLFSGEKPMPNSQSTGHLSGGAGARIDIRKGPAHQNQERVTDPENYLPQQTPLATLVIYKKTLQNKVKDPDLGIYTLKSQQFFRDWLVTDAQQRNAFKTLDSSLPRAEIFQQEKYAVIRFPVTNREASPYFLHLSSTGWQLDFVTMSQTIGFNHRNQWHFRSQKHPYRFAFTDWNFDSNGFPHR